MLNLVTKVQVLIAALTWKHSLDVPGEDSVQEGVEVHHDDGGAEAEVILLQRTRHQVLPLDTDSLLLKQSEVLAAEPERHGGQYALRVKRTCDSLGPMTTKHHHNNLFKVRWSYGKDFGSEADVVLPGHTEHVGQVEGEVDDSSAGGGQVSTGKRGAEEETLHDGYHGEGSQEEEDHPGVTVGQQVPLLYGTQQVQIEVRHIRLITDVIYYKSVK